MNKNIIYIVSFFILIGCKSVTEDLEYKMWNIANHSRLLEDFMSFAVEFPNSKYIDSCKNKMDSIVRDNPSISLSCAYGVDSIRNKLALTFSDTEDNDYYIRRRNAFIITISDSLTTHNGKNLSNDTLFKKLKGYHTNHWNEDNYPQSRLLSNNLFGTILVSKVCVVIDIDQTEYEEQNSINWNLYLKTIQQVKSSYSKIWDYRSMLIWQTNFENLDYNKKLAVIETTTFSMELNFLKREFRK
jgi:hypothetical protein